MKWEIINDWAAPYDPWATNLMGFFPGRSFDVPRLRLRCAQSERHAFIGGWMTIFREGYCRNNQTIRQNWI